MPNGEWFCLAASNRRRPRGLSPNNTAYCSHVDAEPPIEPSPHSSSFIDKVERAAARTPAPLLGNFEEFELAAVEQNQLAHNRPSREQRRQLRRQDKQQRLDEADEMKFSHSIQFNAVPDWSSHYIAYSNLKKLIYQLEKTAHQQTASVHQDAESSPLLQADFNPDQTFSRALDNELEKITSFYQVKEREVFTETDHFLRDSEAYIKDAQDDVENNRPGTSGKDSQKGLRGSRTLPARPRRSSTASASFDPITEDSDDDDEMASLTKSRSTLAKRRRSTALDESQTEDMQASTDFSRRRTSVSYDDFAEQAFSIFGTEGITLKKRAVSSYVQLCELKSFIQLNRTGFSKVLKKYDKILDRKLRSTYTRATVDEALPFRPEALEHIETYITKTETVYADIVTQGDVAAAKRELRLHLREHVVWERNTVWREMIGIERKAQAANLGIRRTLLGAESDPSKARLQGDSDEIPAMKALSTPVGRFQLPSWLLSPAMFTLVAILVVFILMLYIPIMDKPEQQNCLAMLIFVSLLWATEVIPLFVTSLLIPFLCVVLRVVRSDELPHHRLDTKRATSYIFAAMWTPVIMLLLGGFTIAAALSKYDIAKRIATFVLSKAGTRPRTVLLTNMFVAAFASMWISNVAAPVLCFSIIQPLLRNLSADSQMPKALIMGIALSSNIGGMLSPIASPQNIIALENMPSEVSWAEWFFITLPVGIISIVLIWILLLVTFQPSKGTNIVPIRAVKDKFTGTQWFVSFITFATIILWCFSNQLSWLFGEMGVIAIIPLVLFFGTGILTKEDFNNFLWTIIILAAGGLALGKAVNSSGLLQTIATAITARVNGMSLYGVMVVFATMILIVATFISHTVAALIILPLVATVGKSMDEPHPNLLVLGGALMCSAAMGLPTSGFPNMTAIMMEDPQTGQRYLQVKHFISRGVPGSLIALLVVITVGYILMLIAGL